MWRLSITFSTIQRNEKSEEMENPELSQKSQKLGLSFEDNISTKKKGGGLDIFKKKKINESWNKYRVLAFVTGGPFLGAKIFCPT